MRWPICCTILPQRHRQPAGPGDYMRKSFILVGLVAGVFGAGHAQAQSAGVVQFAAGDVKVVAASGSERVARKGVPVSVGDTLLTAPGALAQLKMGDGANAD